MESTQIVASSSRVVSEEEWDAWRDFILDEFLVKDRGLHATLKSLQQRNPHVTLAKFRTKLKQWGFCKKLSSKDWRYINHAIQNRKSQGKDSTVVLSGIRFTSEGVKKQTNRHKSVSLYNKLNPPRSPEPPDEDIPLYICTPRATSPDVVPYREWPRKLPWIQFNESMLPELLSKIRLLPEDDSETGIAALDHQQRKSRIKRRTNRSAAWTAFENLTRRSMEIVIGSEELSQVLIADRSIDRIAAYFNDVIPPTYLDENVRRAIVLSGGGPYETQKEILKILIFLISNHLIMNEPYRSRDTYIRDAQSFVDIFRFSGLATPAMLSKIIELSRNSLTLRAVLDGLYKAAVNSQSFDLVMDLLSIDDQIDPNRTVAYPHLGLLKGLTLLEYMVVCGAIDHFRIEQLTQSGVNINGYYTECPPHVYVIFSTPDMAIQTTKLLLEAYTSMKDRISDGLPLIIARGNFDLIDLFYEAGADFTSITDSSSFLDLNLKIRRCIGLSVSYESIYRREYPPFIDCLGAAASFSLIPFPCNTGLMALFGNKCNPRGKEFWGINVDGQDTALKLVKHILQICGPCFDIDNKLKSNAMIFAALQGHTKVVSFLYERGAHVDARNGLLCPVWAAVDQNQIECCRLLLKLGGSARADYRPIRCCDRVVRSVLLSPLHVAVAHGSRELVDLLIRGGADVNLACMVPVRWAGDSGFQILRGAIADYFNDDPKIKNHWGQRFRSPFAFAMEIGSWEVALLLLDWGAISTDYDLKRATEEGQSLLISKLLETRVPYTEEDMVQFQGVLETSIRNGHESIALNILESGISARNSTLSTALQYGLYRTVMKLIKTGSRLSSPDFAGAFRIPDVSWVQSLTRCHSPVTFITVRSINGRSFLENSILSGDVDVIRLALSLDAFFYDSGALCAVVVAAVQSSSPGIPEVLTEIIRRRELVDQSNVFFDQILENTAVSIAVHHERIDIITQLGRFGERTIEAAVIPKEHISFNSQYSNYHIYTPEDHSCTVTDECYIPLSVYKGWNNWHDPKRVYISPLLLAIKIKCEPAVKVLLDLGYKPDAHALKAAIYHRISLDVTRRLVQECTDLNATEILELRHSYTPLHVAALEGQKEVLNVLLKIGADPNAGCWEDRELVLQRLVEYRRFDIFDILYQSGIDINGTPPVRVYKDTLLQDAAEYGHLGAIHRLISYNADINARGSMQGGSTALEVAVRGGRLDTVQLLLESGVNTEGSGQVQYMLAVHRATIYGYTAIAELLKSHRQWTTDDWGIYHQVKRYGLSGGMFIRPSEYTEEETLEVLKIISEELECRPGRVVILGRHNIIAKTLLSRFSSQDKRELITILHDPADGNEDQLQDTAASADLVQIPQDTIETTDTQLPGCIEESDLEPNTSICFSNTEGLGEDTHGGTHCEIGMDPDRRQQILDDMGGLGDAPAEPMVW
ncbi:ankyrin [Annulohypoxylon maeteangense]|uniref:ankyrin n=1 Tax=Annulohypoxylon maeteangense TaxID=1927788 RepID=UPI00200802E0|nr:ankyrin [Annulohypoxylon maeteangense]KAI0888704.1 ankyrin [Annulohypoxylon maeteangense]